jgi:hypothetical protein
MGDMKSRLSVARREQEDRREKASLDLGETPAYRPVFTRGGAMVPAEVFESLDTEIVEWLKFHYDRGEEVYAEIIDKDVVKICAGRLFSRSYPLLNWGEQLHKTKKFLEKYSPPGYTGGQHGGTVGDAAHDLNTLAANLGLSFEEAAERLTAPRRAVSNDPLSRARRVVRRYERRKKENPDFEDHSSQLLAAFRVINKVKAPKKAAARKAKLISAAASSPKLAM